MDILDGGAGNDGFSTDRGADNIIGGPGRDDASFFRDIPQTSTVLTPNANAGFTVSLDDVANDGPTGAGEGDNVHSDVEDLQFGGRAGDVVAGSAGSNVISTGFGNDSVDPGAGADTVFAGDGDDAVNAVDATTDTIDCGRGTDGANVDLAGAQAARADVTFDCEAISGQAFGAVQPVIDTSKPVLKLSSKTVKVKAFGRNGRLPVKVTCSKPCSLTGEAFHDEGAHPRRLADRAVQGRLGASGARHRHTDAERQDRQEVPLEVPAPAAHEGTAQARARIPGQHHRK